MKYYLSFFFALSFFSANAQRTIIHCGLLIDGRSNEAQSQMSIVVEGDRIVAVSKGFVTKSNVDTLIDLSKKNSNAGIY